MRAQPVIKHVEAMSLNLDYQIRVKQLVYERWVRAQISKTQLN